MVTHQQGRDDLCLHVEFRDSLCRQTQLVWLLCENCFKNNEKHPGWVFFCEAPRKLGRHRWFLLILKPKMMEVAEFHQVCHLKWQTWFMVAIDSFSKNKFCLKIYAAYFMFWHVLISFFFFLNLSLLTCGDSLCKLPVPVRSPARGTIPRTSRTSFTSLIPVLPMSSYEFYPLDGWHNFIGERWVEVTFNYAWGMYNPPFFWSLPCVLPTDHPVWIFEFLNLQGHRKQYNLSCWFS